MTGITLAMFFFLALEVDQNNFSVKILIVCRIGLPLPRNMIGLENSCHPFNQSDGTPRIRHTLACVFSRFWQFACFYLEFLLAFCTGQSL